MNKPLFALTLMVLSVSAVSAQQAHRSNPYEGVSVPPADDEIVIAPSATAKAPAKSAPAKPSAARPAEDPEVRSSAKAAPSQAPSVDPATVFFDPNDDGIVQVAKTTPAEPRLSTRAPQPFVDPDGDIVHPRPTRPGQLGAGTTIRVKLIERLSTTSTSVGHGFRCRVDNDVWQNGQLAIPAGAEISGTVIRVSSGRAGGRGSMRLRPDAMLLPNGARYRMLAELTGTPGSNTHVLAENTVVPNSRMKRNGVEYGGAVGGGAAVGAVLGGPAGALTGGLVGAGIITVHLLASHPQATLETGSTLTFTLTEPLELVQAPHKMTAYN